MTTAPDAASRPQLESIVTNDLHVVALLDVLGQRDKLRKINFQPANEAQEKIALQGVRDTLGHVLRVRDMIKSSAEGHSKGIKSPNYDKFSPEQKQLFDRAMEVKLFVDHFSDTILFYSPVRTKSNDFSPLGIHAILQACGANMLGFLAMGIPVRGAIEIGMANQFNKNELYGPALASAYDLESDVAGFPRIVIGGGALNFFQYPPLNPHAPAILNAFFTDLIQECHSWISTDLDGVPFLDYLGDPFRKSTHGDEHLTEERPFLSDALKFVTDSHEKFSRLGSNGLPVNIKLAQRYGQLRMYLNARIPAILSKPP